MKRRVGCALMCVGAVLAAPAAGSSDTPAPSADPAAPAPEATPAPPPTAESRAIEGAVDSPPVQAAAGEAPADEPPADVGAADAAKPPPASKPRRSARPVARAAAGSVVIRDFEFSPGTIAISAGETVTWTNSGPSGHSATSDSFDTGVFSQGERRSQRFDTAGTFSYFCTVHPSMKGTLRVVASGSTGPGDGVDPDRPSTREREATGGASARDGGETLPDTGLDLLPAGLGIVLVAAGALLGRATRPSAR